MNTQAITTTKLKSVVEGFMQGETHPRIFSFTETKVDNLDFKPIGLQISKQMKIKEKKGGSLMIGFKVDKRTIMEEIKNRK